MKVSPRQLEWLLRLSVSLTVLVGASLIGLSTAVMQQTFNISKFTGAIYFNVGFWVFIAGLIFWHQIME